MAVQNRSMQPGQPFYLPIGPCNWRPKVKYFQIYTHEVFIIKMVSGSVLNK